LKVEHVGYGPDASDATLVVARTTLTMLCFGVDSLLKEGLWSSRIPSARAGSSCVTADWQVFPTTQWNYALTVDMENVGAQESRVGSSPFNLKYASAKLRITAFPQLDKCAKVAGI
jgi:hypothetical protein